MKVLAKVENTPGRYALVNLPDEIVQKKLSRLISKGRYRQAIRAVLSEGNSLYEVSSEQAGTVEADLILTGTSAHWELI